MLPRFILTRIRLRSNVKNTVQLLVCLKVVKLSFIVQNYLEILKPSDKYMYSCYNVNKYCILNKQHIYKFDNILVKNTDFTVNSIIWVF